MEENKQKVLNHAIEVHIRNLDEIVSTWNNLFNSILTLNGIFLAFLAIIFDKIHLCRHEIIFLGALLILPNILIIVLFINHLHSRHIKKDVFFKGAMEIINQPENNPTHYPDKKTTKAKFKSYHAILKILQPIIVSCSIITSIYIFILLFRIDP
jgi:hypothetical protein